tara:strand:+ start:44 stop:940 length:897 start_codon:yes stop_codon:yes gene_type:complete
MGVKIFDGETNDLGGGTLKRNEDQEKALEDAVALKKEEEKHLEQNKGLRVALRPIKALNIMRVEVPPEIIDEINQHIDDVVVPNNESFAKGLVGQLKNNEKSAQLDFPLDDEVGQSVKTILEQVGTSFLRNGYQRDAHAELHNIWVNNAYAGDYNPFHDHGVKTMAGLSGFLWLKVPECIQKLDADISQGINDANGAVDGFTHLIWGTNTRKDVLQLKGQTEDYVKPEVGVMLVFPNWLKHQVLPFFGEGERRSMAFNWNVHDSDREKMKYMSENEKEKYEALRKEQRAEKDARAKSN